MSFAGFAKRLACSIPAAKSVRSLLLILLAFCLSPGRADADFTQQGPKLIGSGAIGAAQQGYSVSLSADGSTAIISGPEDNNRAGAAWVFTRSNGAWSQQAKLVGTGALGPAFQYAVALSADGNTAIVGGPLDNDRVGAGWVFIRSNGTWSQQAKLISTDAVGAATQGQSVSLSADGNTAIIGGPNDNSLTGAAWVFTRSNGVWSQQGPKLVGTGAEDNSGHVFQGTSVSLSADGNTAIIGGPIDSTVLGHITHGAAWVFTRSNGVWSQQGPKLVGTGFAGSALQGESVAHRVTATPPWSAGQMITMAPAPPGCSRGLTELGASKDRN